jgi:nitrogen-specific signal transduction histidine kinase
VRASEATKEEMLNRIAAIKAAAEILDNNHELSHGDPHAFLAVIQTETARLQALVRQIASLFPDCLRLGSATSA